MGDLRVELSPLDEERFHVRTVRAQGLDLVGLPEALRVCEEEGAELLIARLDSSEVECAQALEAAGGRLCDTLIHYGRNFAKRPLDDLETEDAIRPVQEDEVEEVVRMAAETFRGYRGHYHADPRLDREACDEVYRSWAERSCRDRTVADDVLVLPRDGALLGFATMRLASPEVGEGVLFGVSPAAQGQGIYGKLIRRGLLWCRERGATSMHVSTQITNLAVQKVWVRSGFEPQASHYTFHLWLRDER